MSVVGIRPSNEAAERKRIRATKKSPFFGGPLCRSFVPSCLFFSLIFFSEIFFGRFYFSILFSGEFVFTKLRSASNFNVFTRNWIMQTFFFAFAPTPPSPSIQLLFVCVHFSSMIRNSRTQKTNTKTHRLRYGRLWQVTFHIRVPTGQILKIQFNFPVSLLA